MYIAHTTLADTHEQVLVLRASRELNGRWLPDTQHHLAESEQHALRKRLDGAAGTMRAELDAMARSPVHIPMHSITCHP